MPTPWDSVDDTEISPLDRECHRNRTRCWRNVLDHAVHVYVYCVYISQPLGLPLRSQRLRGVKLELRSHPLQSSHFGGIRVPAGCSLLGGLTIVCALVSYPLYYWGANLRGRSKYAVK